MSFRPVSEGLVGMLLEWVGDPAAREAVICRAWAAAVGTTVARRAVAREYRDGTLVVEVTDPSWVGTLEAMSGELRAKVNAALGGEWVRAIEWRGDQDPEDSPKG